MTIQTITIPTSTTNIQIHHFKTSFMCPRSIAGVPFDSVGRFWASLLLHNTWNCSCCAWSASSVAAEPKKKKEAAWIHFGSAAFPITVVGCAPLQCIRSWYYWRASCHSGSITNQKPKTVFGSNGSQGAALTVCVVQWLKGILHQRKKERKRGHHSLGATFLGN